MSNISWRPQAYPSDIEGMEDLKNGRIDAFIGANSDGLPHKAKNEPSRWWRETEQDTKAAPERDLTQLLTSKCRGYDCRPCQISETWH
jgi:hypothetical protein